MFKTVSAIMAIIWGRRHLLISNKLLRKFEYWKNIHKVKRLSPFWVAIDSSTSRCHDDIVTNIPLADISTVIRQLINFYFNWLMKWNRIVYYNSQIEGIRSFLCGLLIFSAKMITLIQKSINFYCQVDGIYWTEIKNNFSIKCCSLSVTALHTGEVMLSNRFSFRVCVKMKNWL